VAATRSPVGTILLLGLAGFLYALMMANLVDAQGTDAAGRGLAMAFGALIGLALWIVLAVLLVVAAVRGRMPAAARVAAVVLLPLSAVAVFVAIDRYDRPNGWFLLVPALLPPLIAFYGLWARLPALHTRMPALATSLAVGGAILAISVAPLAVSFVRSLPNPERDARRAAEAKAQLDKEQQEEREWRAREDAKFARLGPDSPLRAYLDYLASGDSRFQEALAGARQVKSRQADAVALLKEGKIIDLDDLWQLDLQPTPALCEAYGGALGGAASNIARARTDYLTVAMELERQLPNIKWLVGAHCDLGEPLGLLEARVRDVSDSPRMEQFADTVAALRQSH
jgi:hypothetical protein